MIGRGRFSGMTGELRNPQARRLSAALRRACGCHLVWHRLRGVYVVVRDRGSAPPACYMDVGNQACPLAMSAIPRIVDAVRWTDARTAQDFNYLMKRAMQRDSDRTAREFERERAAFLPEFEKDVKRFMELVGDAVSSKSVKYVDLGGKLPLSSLAMAYRRMGA